MPSGPASPPITAPLSGNTNPINVDAGPLGKIYVGGVVSGLGFNQSHHVPGDTEWRGDVSNAQVFVQKTDGMFQFYVQAGAYSLPSLGASYLKSNKIMDATYDAIPIAYAKLQLTPEISILAGKLPTLIGAEYTFTFQNPNIERGLLWNQETAISRGVQANYAKGPLTISISWNDGFYSDRYTTGSALISYVFTPKDTLALVGDAQFKKTSYSSFATPYFQNNGQIYNAIWTHTDGPLTVIPYFQYTHVPAAPEVGITHDANTISGAILGKYSFTPTFSIAARGEYISSSDGGGTTNLLYGPGSKAWSATITPTYQLGIYFMRAEFSYTQLNDFAPGAGFGPAGMNKGQARGLLETGVLF